MSEGILIRMLEEATRYAYSLRTRLLDDRGINYNHLDTAVKIAHQRVADLVGEEQAEKIFEEVTNVTEESEKKD